MKLSAPTVLLFWISLILAALGVIGHFQSIQIVSPNQFWFVVGGYALLAIGCLFKKA